MVLYYSSTVTVRRDAQGFDSSFNETVLYLAGRCVVQTWVIHCSSGIFCAEHRHATPT